jgi:hypothetical protein
MGSELERRAKEWVEGEPKETADLLELGFRAGWKVCREAAKKYAEERFETYLMFLDNFGDEPEEVKKKYVSATISKEAMEASKDKEFMKLVKDWRAEKSIGFRTYEYKGIPIEIHNNPRERAAQLRAMGVNAVALPEDLDCHDFAWTDATGVS